MKPRLNLTIFGLLAILCTQCSRYSYYMSPMHTVDHPYRPQLLAADSATKATFLNFSLSGAGYNDDLVDGAWLLQSSVFNTHKFGNFRGWYGGTIGFGTYDVAEYSGYNAFGNTDPNFINIHAGNASMGGVGVFGGLSVVTPIDDRAEWRVLSIETSYLKEFGQYLQFRNKMNDTLVDAFYNPSYFFTTAFGTEFATKTKKGSFGVKLNYIMDWNRLTGSFENGKINPRQTAFTTTFHFGSGPVNYFLATGFGSYAFSMQFGMNFRLRQL